MKKIYCWGAAVLLAAFLMVPPAAADMDEASAKDPATKTVIIGGERYQVNDKTVIRDLKGHKLSFAGLPLPREGGRDQDDPVFVEFESVDTRDGPALISVQIVERPK